MVKVVFVTTVFEGTDTGPGTYARYLWNAFRDDPQLEFHLVAPQVAESHPRLHASGSGKSSLDLYRRVQEAGLRVAAAGRGHALVHGNSTHSMSQFLGYPGPLLVQVNDYDVATFPKRAASILGQQGVRRLVGCGWRHLQERRILQHATLAICNSGYTAEAVRCAYGLLDQKLRVVHKAVDTAGFQRPGNPGPDPVPGRPIGARLVFVGMDWRRKGLDVLLAAIQQLVATIPTVTLIVIGPDRNDVKLEALVRGYRLSQHVHILGGLGAAQVARHLWYADAFVLPSRREALGVAVLEAMAAGVPVVATRVGGIPEIVRSDDEGLLVKPGESDELAQALRKLLLDAGLRRRLCVVGVARARAFSVATMVRAVRDIYLKIDTSVSASPPT